jgi:hypothetical protein
MTIGRNSYRVQPPAGRRGRSTCVAAVAALSSVVRLQIVAALYYIFKVFSRADTQGCFPFLEKGKTTSFLVRNPLFCSAKFPVPGINRESFHKGLNQNGEFARETSIFTT